MSKSSGSYFSSNPPPPLPGLPSNIFYWCMSYIWPTASEMLWSEWCNAYLPYVNSVPIQWVPGTLSLGVKRPGRETDNSHPSSVEVKECVELYFHFPNTPSWRGAQLKHRDNFTMKLTSVTVCLFQLCLVKHRDNFNVRQIFINLQHRFVVYRNRMQSP
jgi:hypothetical protein